MIKDYINKIKEVANLIDVDKLNDISEVIYSVYRKNKTVYSIGNGGSAATASHFACDISKGTKQKLRAISLVDNMAVMTACANDFGYEKVFINQLENVFQPGDMVVAFSGSGNSKNVLEAVKYVNEHKEISIGITGYDGGELNKICSIGIVVPINDMQISEDFHLIITHIIMRTLQAIV